MLWMREDKAGGWVRAVNLLKINNMYLQQGTSVPSLTSAIKETVLELINACILDGAHPSLSLEKPLTFSAFVKIMEEKGLFRPIPLANHVPGPGQLAAPPGPVLPMAAPVLAQPSVDPPNAVPAQPTSDMVEKELSTAFRSEVRMIFSEITIT